MNRIKELLDEKGISQTWVAERIGKSFSVFNGYVLNKKQPSIEVLFEIAKLLKIQPASLLKTIPDLNQFQGDIINQDLIKFEKQFNYLPHIKNRVYTARERVKCALDIVNDLLEKEILIKKDNDVIYEVKQWGNFEKGNGYCELKIKFIFFDSNSFKNGVWIQVNNKKVFLHLPFTKKIILNEFSDEELVSQFEQKVPSKEIFKPLYYLPFNFKQEAYIRKVKDTNEDNILALIEQRLNALRYL